MGVNDDDEIWPYLIGKYLSERVPDRRIEVLNEGIMGYTSLGNLLDLALRVIDFDCDVYIIYLGVNDLFAKAPLDVYRTDYSHFRVTLYERLLSSPAQSVPSLFLQLKTVRAALELGGARDSRDLISNTCTSQFRRRFWMEEGENERIERTMRETVVRNVTSMVGVIRGHRRDAMIILSSFYDLEGRRLLKDLNEDFREIAAELRIVFADVGRDVPRDQSMAYDYGHFTPEGDRRMATLFTDLVVENLASWGRRAP